MATTDTPSASVADCPDLLGRAQSHSWEYGRRCVDREGDHRETWTDETGRQSLAVFDVTDHTVVLRVTSPVGRESFYGMAERDYEAARAALADEGWAVRTAAQNE